MANMPPFQPPLPPQPANELPPETIAFFEERLARKRAAANKAPHSHLVSAHPQHVRSKPDQVRQRTTEPESVVPAASTALHGRLVAFKGRAERRARECAPENTAPHSRPVGAYPQHVRSEPPLEQAPHGKTQPESAVTEPSAAFNFDLNTCLGTVRYSGNKIGDLLRWIGRHFILVVTLSVLYVVYMNMPSFSSFDLLQYPASLIVAALNAVTGRSTSSKPSLPTPITAYNFDQFRYKFEPGKLQNVVSSGDTANLNLFKTIAAGGNTPALDLLEPVDRASWNARTPRTTLNDTQQSISDFASHLRSRQPWLITFIQAQSRQDAGKDDAGQDESTGVLCWVRRRLGLRSCESVRLEQDAKSLYNWAVAESNHRKDFLSHGISWSNVTMITSSMEEDLCSMLDSLIRVQAMDAQQEGPQPKWHWLWSNREEKVSSYLHIPMHNINAANPNTGKPLPAGGRHTPEYAVLQSDAMHLNKAACFGGKILKEKLNGLQKVVADEVIELDLIASMAQSIAEQAQLGYDNVCNFSLKSIAVRYYEFLGRVYFLSQ